ncbi:hypothetical protein, conserved in T. vivax [Trypanosoma vivax Y486]|uniref:Uncharacterized protein n=1 Tax=Trypanosoma vivax (strain Y486) TaxID=1055687 RepID=F9WVH8_TRYVY|nr:hypothetical protein, conserved in T. vivax [Trypanosoma vivax Y486]|eukprot:CCD21586.1 hypothetical protein, conserved in T. vivax [Trypanosoma vivax Y486]
MIGNGHLEGDFFALLPTWCLQWG